MSSMSVSFLNSVVESCHIDSAFCCEERKQARAGGCLIQLSADAAGVNHLLLYVFGIFW